MKRVLAFLLLFGLGLALLHWLESRGESDAPGGGAPPVAVPDGPDGARSADEPEPPVEDRTERGGQDEPGRRIGVRPGGPFSYTSFDEVGGGRRTRVDALDSGVVEGNEDVWELRDVDARAYDPATQTLQAQLDAARGLIVSRAGASSYDPDFEDELTLLDAVMVVHEGSPVVPLTVETPRMLLDLASQTHRSPGTTKLSSPELVATGEDVDVDLGAHVLRIARDGRIDFLGDGRVVAVLSARGRLVLSRGEPREPGGRRPLTIEARDQARLELEDGRDSLLTSDSIRIRGREPEPGADFALDSLEADGEVVWHSNDDVFEGDRATVFFHADGRPQRAILSGEPSGRIATQDELVPGAGDVALVLVSGAGPLGVRWDERTSFVMGGPSVVRTQGATLTSRAEIGGWMRDDGSAGVEAGGGVELEIEGAVLETTRIDLRLGPDPPAGVARRLRGIASGGARLVGPLEDGREFTLSTPDHLEVAGTRDAWVVVEATDVVVSVEEPRGFRARARRVRDFDPATRTFTAEGDIVLESGQGTATGERLVVRGERSFLLEGTREERAVFEAVEGRAEAVSVDLTDERVVAREAVSAALFPAPAGGDRVERFDLACDELVIHRSPVEPAGDEYRRVLRFDATGHVSGQILSGLDATDVRCGALTARLEELVARDAGVEQVLESSATATMTGGVDGTLSLDDARLAILADELIVSHAEDRAGGRRHDVVARRNVHFDGEAGIDFAGQGHVLTLDQDRRGILTAEPGGRVRVDGVLPSSGEPFELTGTTVAFSPAHVAADDPEITTRVAYPTRELVEEQGAEAADRAGRIRARARRLTGDEGSLELVGDVRVDGATARGIDWKLDADAVRFEGSAGTGSEERSFKAFRASGAVSFRLGSFATASGRMLEASQLFGTWRLEGSPAVIDSPTFRVEAEWIEFDPVLQVVTGSGRGRMLPVPQDPPEDQGTGDTEPVELWSLEYHSSKTLIEADSLIYVMQEPVFRHPSRDVTVRASWVLFWIDRRRWIELPDRLSSGELDAEALRLAPDPVAGQEEPTPVGKLFGRFAATELSQFAREIYFEGPIEVQRGTELIARADAAYLDLVVGHGWIANATVNIYGKLVGQDFDRLIVKTDWLRHSEDGTLRANRATVTPCDHDEPHVRIVTGDLRLTPAAEGYNNVSLRDNRIELYDKIRLPLPPLSFGSDENYRPILSTLRLGDSARFGTLVSASIARPADAVGNLINRAIGDPTFDIDARYQIDASYLGSRGILLDLGLDVESSSQYWLEMRLGGLPDSGRDRGYIRVDKGDRDTLRLWFRTRGRYLFGPQEWLDVAASVQTDPGVQSEFFESDFERYEQSDNYVHWRKAHGAYYFDAIVEKRLESHRTDVEQLPSAGVYRGRSAIATLGSLELLHTGDARVAYLRRLEGDLGVQSPFGFPSTFRDGLGDREVTRFDTSQRIEAPVSLGVAGARATPFVGARFTAWDQAALGDGTPTRVVGEAGLRLASSFWKLDSKGRLHQLAPFVEVRGDVVHEQSGGDPVPFDRVEQSLEGTFVDVGTRARIGLGAEGATVFDVEVRGTHASSLADGGDRWLPVGVFARLLSAPWGRALELFHDGRFDFDADRTVYALTGAALRLDEDLRFEALHRRGVGNDGGTLFEAATLSGIYTWTQKWEFEALQTLSLLDDNPLASRFIVRRYGHDIVFELESSFREGEGTSLGFSVRPRFGYRRSGLGYLDF